MTLPSLVPLVSAFVFGLAGSTHCLVMCGGVVGMASASMPVRLRKRPLRQLPLALSYNLGRITSYGFGGIIAGGVGAVVVELGVVHRAQLGLQIIAAAFMIGAGLHLAGFLPAFAKVEVLGKPIWSRIEPFARRFFPVDSPLRAMGLGLLWGWLPCGLVYAALALALVSGSALEGGLTMLAFGLGTLPMLLAMNTVAGALARVAKHPTARRVAGLALGLMGAFALVTAARNIQAELTAVGDRAVHASCH